MDLCNSFSKLKTLFEEEYCPLTIRYESISREVKENIINKYKQKKKIPYDENIDIKNIINIKNILIQAFQYLKNYKEFNSDLKNNLNQIKINNKKQRLALALILKEKINIIIEIYLFL